MRASERATVDEKWIMDGMCIWMGWQSMKEPSIYLAKLYGDNNSQHQNPPVTVWFSHTLRPLIPFHSIRFACSLSRSLLWPSDPNTVSPSSSSFFLFTGENRFANITPTFILKRIICLFSADCLWLGGQTTRISDFVHINRESVEEQNTLKKKKKFTELNRKVKTNLKKLTNNFTVYFVQSKWVWEKKSNNNYE